MPTVSGGGNLERVIRPLIEVSVDGWGQWEAIDDAEILSAQVASGAHDIGRFTFSLKWGNQHMQPWESAQGQTMPERFINQWARLTIYDGEDSQIVACGKIAADDREFFGRVAGIQTFTAYGPGQILRRIGVYQSRWADATAGDRLDWIPPVNMRSGKAEVSGNRSDDPTEDGYAYGGKKQWTHKQYLEYLLSEFVDESEDDGPSWTLTGQSYVLDQFTDPVRVQASTTAADLLRRLVPERFGLDYTFRITDDGFEIEVFSLSASATSYGETTIPANPNRISFDLTESPQVTIRLAQTEDHGYGRLTVLSARAIVCTTLDFGDEEENREPSLEPRWSEDDYDDYLEGTGNDEDPPSLHDAIRTRGKWRSVFADFGAPDDWQEKPEPQFDENGRVQQQPASAFQLTDRATLAWTPLQAGWDYSQNPPQKQPNADTDATEAEFLPPQVWLGQPSEDEPDEDTAIWVPVANCGHSIGVAAPQHDWGVILHATPHHIIAMCEDGGFDPAEHATEHEPVYDYHNLRATIAFESDHRVRLSKAIPNAAPSDGELVITVEDAQCWILAPGTMVGVNDEMQPVISPDQFVEIRNDVAKLEAVMAGAIARYQAGRIRGQVHRKGLRLWARLVGCLLVTDQWTSPITSVGWRFGDHPETVCNIGYCG